jgi:ATP-dependent helicase Lhr and Lhr-like helicase
VPDGEAGTAFDLLHPSVQHHVVNSLGWRSLRALQGAAIGPILAGEHVVATAPTAGGKTEAAVLPLLSRMLSEHWHGLTVLYVCPLRALLNNLFDRLVRYGDLVGRSVGLWHGDTARAERRRLLGDPPDILLTTPESLESMLVSTSVDHHRWFAAVRSVVVDEVHAFAGDDRGWHLLTVLERVQRLAGRELQRIGLSATLAKPDDLLHWLTSTAERPGCVVEAGADDAAATVTLDHVGSLANAALVISRMHRGEKRLVFVDSRSRAEQLAYGLRGHGVTTFVSHGSLGAAERRGAEEAFNQARDCVIVATSTLELGIDVGDLDHVIQVDAPPTVAAFLQRLGRTGRRAGSARSALVLATGDEDLLRSAAVLLRWRQRYVEPVTAPDLPLHLVAQQLLALSLQENGVGRSTWMEWLGHPFVLGRECAELAGVIADHLVAKGFLGEDGGILGIGAQAEVSLGRQHFMDLLSVFTSPPMFSVRHGRHEIGLVPDETLTARPPGASAGGADALILAGRSWAIRHVDWPRRVVQVEPTEAPGVARWTGQGLPLGAHVARGVRDVLIGAAPEGVELSRRAQARLSELRAEHDWAAPSTTTVVADDRGRVRWWTFAGWKANLWLARVAEPLRTQVAAIDDLTVALDPNVEVESLAALLTNAAPRNLDLAPWIVDEAVDGLKFSECLPRTLALEVVVRRLSDWQSVSVVRQERLGLCRVAAG